MAEQEEFFTRNHDKLFNIARWAKFIAGILLPVFVLLALIELLQSIGVSSYSYNENSQGFWNIFKTDPALAIDLVLTPFSF